jgi:protein SCO1/2
MLNRTAGESQNKLNVVLIAFMLVILFAVSFIAGGALIRQFAPAAAAAPAAPSMAGAGVVNPPVQMSDFTLTRHTGEAFSLSELRGQAVFLFFGYTNCPDVCPGTLADFTRVKAALGEDGDRTAFVFISVDGERDTPERMGEYLSHFDSEFIGLLGDKETLLTMGAEYGLTFEPGEIVEHVHEDGSTHVHDESGFINHTSPAFLIDPDGKLRMVFFNGAASIETMTVGARQILGETT